MTVPGGIFNTSTHQTAHGIHYVGNLFCTLQAFVSQKTWLSTTVAASHDSTRK